MVKDDGVLKKKVSFFYEKVFGCNYAKYVENIKSLTENTIKIIIVEKNLKKSLGYLQNVYINVDK